MAELSQRSQERIAKSSTDRLCSHLVRSGLDEGEITELKATAVQMEAENVLEGGPTEGVSNIKIIRHKNKVHSITIHKITFRQVNITAKYLYHKNCKILFYGGFMLGWV